MTFTVGQLLAAVLCTVVAAMAAALGWQTFHPGGPPSFNSQAGKICRTELPAIANAPDFQTALAHARIMRNSIYELTPPPNERVLVTAWIAALKDSEDAGLRGDWAAAEADDARIKPIVAALGLTDSCEYKL
jgi:hypothetical protein